MYFFIFYLLSVALVVMLFHYWHYYLSDAVLQIMGQYPLRMSIWEDKTLGALTTSTSYPGKSKGTLSFMRKFASSAKASLAYALPGFGSRQSALQMFFFYSGFHKKQNRTIPILLNLKLL